MEKEQKNALSFKTRALYDFQKLRMQTNARINNPKSGVKLSEEDKEFLRKLGNDLENIEKGIEKQVNSIVEQHPLWAFFNTPHCKGIGKKMAAILISYIDPYRMEKPSSLWSYCGVAVYRKVQCTKCEHISYSPKMKCQRTTGKDKKTGKLKICGAPVIPMEDEHGNIIKGRQRLISGEACNFNRTLKTKILGVLVPCLMKAKNPYYSKIYYDYKARLEAKNWGKSKLHRHRAAIRQVAKCFLLRLYKEFRLAYDLEVRPPYAEQYLSRGHHE